MCINQPMTALLQVVLCLALLSTAAADAQGPAWSDEELKVIKTLWIGGLPPPVDKSNAYADSPQAAMLGLELFHDARFSSNQKVSCLICHRADMAYCDALPLAKGVGQTPRRSMPVIGVAYNTWFFWDGRKDSLWSQALGPPESPVEHGISRIQCTRLIHKFYKEAYEEVFGPLPAISDQWPDNAMPSADNHEANRAWLAIPERERDAINRVYANFGKAIAAYEMTIRPGPAPFDKYAEALIKGDPSSSNVLGLAGIDGLRLFIGKAGCVECHGGPLLTDGGFHDIGIPEHDGIPADAARGRASGIAKVLADEFNCLGKYSDARPEDCKALNSIDRNEERYLRAFKTPTLRNLTDRPPYMHNGRYRTLADAVGHFRRPRSPKAEYTELTEEEQRSIEAFLRSLNGSVIELRE